MPRICERKREQGWLEPGGEMISIKCDAMAWRLAHNAAFNPCGSCWLTLTLFFFVSLSFLFFSISLFSLFFISPIFSLFFPWQARADTF
jgi:hypothetical protein